MSAFVYILQSESGFFYIGSTVNVTERLRHHQSGHTPSTKRLGTVRLVLTQEYASLSEARRIERKIKKLKRRDYIEKMVKDGKIRLTV